MKVLLLGVGMQGKAALRDLAGNDAVTEVVAADLDTDALRQHVEEMGYRDSVRCEHVDASNLESLDRLLGEKPDVVIDLLPPSFIVNVASAAVNHGIHVVNTFFTVPGLRQLEDEARERNVTILPEFGLDPGIDLVLLGEAVRSLDTVEEIRSYGAGIPELEAADNPLKYKVAWTFEGVLQAYSRGAQVIQDGKVVEIEPSGIFSPENIHQIEIAGLGALEAYPNGDAVAYTETLGIDPQTVRSVGRYSMRWPGHCAFWSDMVRLHLLDAEPVIIDGVPVDRVRFLAEVIAPHIQYGPDERDVVVVRVEVMGTKEGQSKHIVHQLVDRRDLETGLTAMSRTVGYTASIGAIMIATGRITERGVLSPAIHVPFDPLVRELRSRGIEITSEPARTTR